MNVKAFLEAVRGSDVFCPDHRVEIDRVFRILFDEPEEETFAVGDRLFNGDYEYLLAVGGGGVVSAQLVNIITGKRWAFAVPVGSLCGITAKEFASIANGDEAEFTRKEK